VWKITGARGSEQKRNSYTKSTFQSLVQAIIPPTPGFTESLGTVQVAGALELDVYEYAIWVLDHSIAIPAKVPLNLVTRSMSKATAELLDVAATQLIRTKQIHYPLNVYAFPEGGPFTKLWPVDRLRALSLLERLEINLENLNPPYKNNPGLIRNMMDVLNQLTMFGHYSEWIAYGTTRLFSPEYRRIEYFPYGWIQSQYPGPSFGYRDFRGFLAVIKHKKGKDEWRVRT
jgi:hypothetical protein